jgi:hypothetical protein
MDVWQNLPAYLHFDAKEVGRQKKKFCFHLKTVWKQRRPRVVTTALQF